MKRKILSVLVFALTLVMLFGSIGVSAYEAYDTYTYSIDGERMLSPNAYSADGSFNSKTMGLTEKFGGLSLSGATDLVTDEAGNVYIADAGNNRIVVLNKYYEAIATISEYVDENGRAQKLTGPKGLFVTDPRITADGESYIYICDTGYLPASRIVVFDRSYNYVRTIYKPKSDILEDAAFKLTAIAVDKYGRIFAVSPNCYEGIIVMSGEGDFTGFIGAQKVSYSLLQILWRRFQTKEQIRASYANVSVAYNNICVDENGFVYVTNNNINAEKQFAALASKDAGYSPVKKLNSAGNEIMKRNGFFDPGGEVDVKSKNVSSIIDVAIGPEGSWSILEESKGTTKAEKRRSRIFTYDQNGNLLFAFGDKGYQMGNAEEYVAFTYQVIDGVYYIIALDNTATGYKVTVYSPTPYCDTIIAALRNSNEHHYSDSILFWQQVLKQNNNFDLAYIGIGKALYSQGRYEDAMEMFKHAYETDQYARAFSEVRKDIIGKWLLPLVIGIIAIVVLFLKFMGYCKKRNKAVSLKVGRKTYWEELIYSFHLVFHPFDGFWDLKHEQRGSVRAALTILAMTIVAFFYQAIGQGYMFAPRGSNGSAWVQVVAIVVPVLLWVVSNWCLTTLFDGEGSFKDIFIATCYALAPLPLFVVVSTILSNVMTTSEGSIVTMLITFGYIWVGLLLFFGMLVTHDYSLGKNVAITLFTIVAMMVIMFVAILFSSLLVKMVTFVVSIITEISNRV